MNRQSFIIIGIIITLFIMLRGLSNMSLQMPEAERSYSSFLKSVKQGEVQSAEFDLQNAEIHFKSRDGKEYYTYNPEVRNNTAVIGDLEKANVEITMKRLEGRSIFAELLMSLLPIALIVGFWFLIMRQMQGGGKGPGGALSFGKSKARLMDADKAKITFKDVAGIDEVKEELVEMVDYLKDPAKFNRLGGKIPRGALMVGAPGTGKTLLAKAVAGEAKVPFFSISGSDFVEMFVGVGAARVRDMFAEAKKHAPCIIFIDEIDAVGRHRGAGMGGGNDEREQTLNQMLVEMDGFEGNEGIIVIAATNRADVLDKALLRPGRFDRQIVVPMPDVKGRTQILKVHMKKVPLADDVKPKVIARGTPGFSGADLANLVNEAALCAARNNDKQVNMAAFDFAKDKIMMGSERRSMVMSDEEKLNTAYHEAGHAIVGRLSPEHDPVYKVTIIPRGRALGVTMFLPEKDNYSHSKRYLESNIATLYAGRIAEEMTLGKEGVTTGASNDIERATAIATNMVTRWGYSEKLAPLLFVEENEYQQHISGSDETRRIIDEEIKDIIDRNYQRAEQILADNRDILEAMAQALMKYETINKGQIDDLMARQTVRKPDDDYDMDDDNTGAPVIDEKPNSDEPLTPPEGIEV